MSSRKIQRGGWVLLSFALALGAPYASGRVVYITPTGAGTADGTSWSNASRFSVALTNCASGDEFRLSAGLHLVSGPLGTVATFTDKSLTIRGGYPGLSEAETPGTNRYATVISGDPAGNDVWARFDPETGTETTQFGGVYLPVVDRQAGAVNPPPAFSAGYDVYYPVQTNGLGVFSAQLSDNVRQLLVLNNASSLTVENLAFTGFGLGTAAGITGCLVDFKGTSRGAFRDVVFFGCSSLNALLHQNAENLFSLAGCEVRNCHMREFGLVHFEQSKSWAVITNCVFRGIYSSSGVAHSGGAALSGWQCKSLGMTNCVFSRIVRYRSSSDTGGSYPAVVLSFNGFFPKMDRCEFYDNYGRNTLSAPVMYSSASMTIRNSRFTNNKVICPYAGTALIDVAGVLYGAGSANQIYACSFVSNSVQLVSSTAASTCTSPLYFSQIASLVNCTFFDNAGSAQIAVPSARRVVSRALLCRNKQVQSYVNYYSVLNCTFSGTTPGDDIVFTGGEYAYPRTGYVANSILWSDAPGYRGVTAERSGQAEVCYSLVKNAGNPLPNVPGTGVFADDPQLAFDAANQVLRPTVRVPGIDQTSALFDCLGGNGYGLTNFPGRVRTVPFATQSYNWIYSAVVECPDALGTPRPPNASTAGAVQTTFAAGDVLVARSIPPSGGGVTPQSQTVTGGTAAPLTAQAADGYAFVEWRDEAGQSLATTNTLQPTVSGDTVVYAVFTAPDTLWSFSLGDHGTFTSTGTGQAQVSATPGGAAPATPAFTIDPDWDFVAWDPPLPEIVPVTNGTFTAVWRPARTIIYFDSHATGTRSGENWANAVVDLKDAMTLATNAAHAEIRVKAGFHIPTTTANLVPPGDLTLIGGFTGDGDTRLTDPLATVFSGDIQGNDLWYGPNGLSRGAVMTSTQPIAFAPINPAAADSFWYVGNHAENLVALFNLENWAYPCALHLEAITFTGFGRGNQRGPVANGGIDTALVVTNCVLIANRANNSNNAGVIAYTTGGRVRDCRFIGNYGSSLNLWNKTATAWTDRSVEIFDCTFEDNYTKEWGSRAAAVAVAYGTALIRGCDFLRNYADDLYNYSPAVCVGVEGGSVPWIADSRFVGNVYTNADGGLPSIAYAQTFSNCLFRANRVYVEAGKESLNNNSYTAICNLRYNNAEVSGCAFVENLAGNGKYPAGAVMLSTGGLVVNCSFGRNRAQATVSGGLSSTIGLNGDGGIVNCTFYDNSFQTAELLNVRSAACNAALVNTVLWNGAPAYAPFATASYAFNKYLWNSTIRNYDAGDASLKYSIDILSADPLLSREQADASGLHRFRLLRDASSSARSGYGVSLGNATLLAHDGTSWRTMRNPGQTVSVSNPPAYRRDMLGETRPAGEPVTRGAVQRTLPASLNLIIR